MAKKVHNDVLDGSLLVSAGANQMLACSAEPTDRANALALALASVAVAGGDFTRAAGDVSGRKQTVAAKSGVSVSTSGTANHVVLIDGTRLLDTTTCTAHALTAGNTVNFPSWKREVQAPT